MAKAGAQVTEYVLPAAFDALAAAHSVINDYEAYRALAHELRTAPEKISATIQPRIARWATRTLDEYAQAQQTVADCRRMLRDVYKNFDALLVPSAPGEAPVTLNNTGEAVFNAIWTALHVPAITLPAGTGPTGLPVGVQLVGAYGGDYALLACAAWAEGRLT